MVDIGPHKLTTLNNTLDVNKASQNLITAIRAYRIIIITILNLVLFIDSINHLFLLQTCKTRWASSVGNTILRLGPTHFESWHEY